FGPLSEFRHYHKRRKIFNALIDISCCLNFLLLFHSLLPLLEECLQPFLVRGQDCESQAVERPGCRFSSGNQKTLISVYLDSLHFKKRTKLSTLVHTSQNSRNFFVSGADKGSNLIIRIA